MHGFVFSIFRGHVVVIQDFGCFLVSNQYLLLSSCESEIAVSKFEPYSINLLVIFTGHCLVVGCVNRHFMVQLPHLHMDRYVPPPYHVFGFYVSDEIINLNQIHVK